MSTILFHFNSITKVDQLKGNIGGVNRLGSTSDLGLRLALRKLGVDPEKDVKILPVGGNAERFAALSKGLTQFTIMPEPFLTQAEKLGFRNLLQCQRIENPVLVERHPEPGGDRQSKTTATAEIYPRDDRGDPYHQDRKRIRQVAI